MSILRRLLLSITLAIIVILAGTLAFSINAAREYLAGQLQTQAEDAAVSLALTLSQQSNQDPTTQELLVSALFDGGHFEHVQLSDPDGNVLSLFSLVDETGRGSGDRGSDAGRTI